MVVSQPVPVLNCDIDILADAIQRQYSQQQIGALMEQLGLAKPSFLDFLTEWLANALDVADLPSRSKRGAAWWRSYFHDALSAAESSRRSAS